MGECSPRRLGSTAYEHRRDREAIADGTPPGMAVLHSVGNMLYASAPQTLRRPPDIVGATVPVAIL